MNSVRFVVEDYSEEKLNNIEYVFRVFFNKCENLW